MRELVHTKAFLTRKVLVISCLVFFSDMVPHLEGSTISKDFLDTVVTSNYLGRSWIDRITFRNSLDPINGVWWSDENMDDLFSWRQRPRHPVNVLDPNGTACHNHQMQDLFEISLGSYQPRLTRGYISLIQWLTALHDEDILTLDQCHEHLSRLPTNDEGFITDIKEEPRNWDR